MKNLDGMTWNNGTKKWESCFPTLATHDVQTNAIELPFKTKDEYLAWRAEWRQTYKDLSFAIREQRMAKSSWQSAMAKRANGVHCSDEDMVERDTRLAKANAAIGKITNNAHWRAKEFARFLLEVRKASKIEAGRQYQASLEQRQNQTVAI